MRLLLLSNSTMKGQQFLGWPKEYIEAFLEALKGEVLFIPYAGVSIDLDRYSELVIHAFDKMGFAVRSIHLEKDKATAVANASAIAVGGGNTFQLIKQLQKEDLMAPIRAAVERGTPYIGWSAGSNVACPTIKTTNDMPIVEPISFKALDLVHFQINPHYTDKTIQGHGGESRDQRIAEFLQVEQNSSVIGLAEGSLLKIDNGIELIGAEAKLFRYGQEATVLPEGPLDIP